jgi:hypothetical protein
VSVAEPIRDQANALLNTAMTYAREMLKKEGEFAPFAATLDTRGRLDVAPCPEELAGAEASGQVEFVRAELLRRAAAGELEAAAVAVNVEARRQVEGGFQDAVRVEIEHQDGYCAVILVPYRLSGGHLGGLVPRKIEFSKSMSQPGARWLWPAAVASKESESSPDRSGVKSE